jgi:hypothetical protein
MRKIDLIVLHCSATRADRCYTEYDLITDHLRRGAPVQAITIIYVRTEASRASVPLINPVRIPVAKMLTRLVFVMKAGWTQMVIPVILELPFRNIPCVSW